MAEIRVNATGALKLFDNDDSHFVGLQAGSVSSNVTFTLPTADGSNGQVLTTDGSGALSFATASSANPPSADGDSLGTASLEWSDLYLADGGIIYFGNDQDITVTHDPDDGLFLKSIATADNNPVLLTLQTGETDMAADDVIGKIAFQAPDEGTGTDAILVSAAIQAVAEGDHSSSSNATRLEFHTGASELATSQMTISSGGIVGIGAVPTGDLGVGLHIKTADSGASASANADELVIEGASSDNTGISILSATDGTANINFGDSGDNDIGRIYYNHGSNYLALYTSGTEHLRIDSAGHVTKPKQPASLYTAGDYDNLTGDGTTGDLGQTAGWGLTERWDNNADSVDGIFTAPVTGTYIIAGQVWLDDIASNHNELLIQMTTSNRTYYIAMDPGELPRSSGNSIGIPICAMADMDANDTHVLKIGVGGGSKVVDLISLTTLGIALIC